MWMNVKEITDVSMAAKIFLVATDAAAHKDISSITSGISVWVRNMFILYHLFLHDANCYTNSCY